VIFFFGAVAGTEKTVSPESQIYKGGEHQRVLCRRTPLHADLIEVVVWQISWMLGRPMPFIPESHAFILLTIFFSFLTS
jgi:hypothetical protein